MSAGSDGSGDGGASTALRNTAMAGAGLGCLMSPLVLSGAAVIVVIFGGLGILLAPLIALYLLFTSGGGGSEVTEGDATTALMIVQGDGKVDFDETTVPDDLVDPIEEAGQQCGAITAVVIASQIQAESAFDASKVGPGGRLGISQLPPKVFKQYGKDDDDNGEINARDAADSILAQGRYLCALSDQVDEALDSEAVLGDHLNLVLAAYRVGMDAVIAAKGVPAGNDIQQYILDIRSRFPVYAGIGAPPPTASPDSDGPREESDGGGGKGQSRRGGEGDSGKEEPDKGSPGSGKPGEEHSAPGNSAGFPVSESQFDKMFPNRNPFYTYQGLVSALSAYPAFANTGSGTLKKQEAAAFLANISHETGGLAHVVEQNTTNYSHYCDGTKPYGCPAGQDAYYGRGPIQLSWNVNYKTAGEALGMDLLNKPRLVEEDATVAWKTGLWYWNTQSGPGAMPGHSAMVNGAGFGESIRSINGALECNGGNPAQVESRVANYRNFTQILGVPTGDQLTC
ncbi:hypothetical protein GCM10010310_57380 [Streptomyces violaceolatus]|uniref:Chitinase n=1 Tax=Streptomyces violaceolatus TaxID=67378 RepID=A0ABN3T8B7_9ACTN